MVYQPFSTSAQLKDVTVTQGLPRDHLGDRTG